jgi:hypothetical protein
VEHCLVLGVADEHRLLVDLTFKLCVDLGLLSAQVTHFGGELCVVACLVTFVELYLVVEGHLLHFYLVDQILELLVDVLLLRRLLLSHVHFVSPCPNFMFHFLVLLLHLLSDDFGVGDEVLIF